MSDFIESSKEASKGGFQGIKKIRGLQTKLELVDPPESWESTKKQMQLTLEDAAILVMAEGEDEFELKDNKFTCMWGYAEEGKKPHANSTWMKCAVASAESMGKRPSQFTGEMVTLEKKSIILFQQRDKTQPKGEDGKYPLKDIVVENYFCYVADETVGSSSLNDYLQDKLTGLTEKAALRELLGNTRAKQHPELKDDLKAGTLGKKLGLVLVDGKFQKEETSGGN